MSALTVEQARALAASWQQGQPPLDAGREAANELGPQRRYLILIGRRDEPRLVFECMAPSSGVAWNRHVHLCRPLERCEVRAV